MTFDMKKVCGAFAAIAIMLFACTPEDNNSGDPDNGKDNLALSVTVEANHISAISAVLAGKANLGSTVASDLKVGFQYSKSAGILPSNSLTIEATDADADYNYTTAITGLDPDTKYYFRSFVRQNGQDTYGETREFTTKNVASLLETKEANNIEATKVTLNARLDLTDVQYKSLAYGFLWGTSESALNTDYKCTEISDNAISAALTNLSHKTQYWYKVYTKLDNQTFYGEIKTFTTDVVLVESISLDKTEYTFNTIGTTLTLKATVFPADATDKGVTWNSDKEDVATVDANGSVTAKGNGQATITVATTDQNKTASCVITVAQWVTSISLDKTSISLNEGQEQTLTATINPSTAADKSINWSSTDESIVIVNNNGQVTAISKGTATIKAEARDGSGKYASCSVTVNRLVSSIQLNKTTISVYNGKSETLTATVMPSDASNTAVNWSSSNTSVATVSNSGMVTGKSKGTATITVTAKDGNGAQATCEVEVKQYVSFISIDRSWLTLVVGNEATLTVTTVSPDNANDKTYIWSSSDDAIASVDSSGKVTAKSKGTTTIKATANDGSGSYATCSVAVILAEPLTAIDMGLSVKWANENVGASAPEDCGDYYAWGETASKSDYSWSTYQFGTSSSGPFSKYNTIDNKTVLDSEDDVAHVKLGGSWRMPTENEWTELKTKCTWAWITQNGAKGMLVTAPNGNAIFIPLTFFTGYYWSSSLINSGDLNGAWCVGFNSSGLRPYYYYERYRGLSVRPVSE